MNKIESDKTDNESNISQGNTSISDTQDFISSDDEIKSGVHQKFNIEFLGCNNNENGKRSKKRSTKKELYQKEREEFIKELNNIIGINNDNNNVFKHDIEKNVDFENFIKGNTEKIRKMWKTGLWGYFSNDIEKGSGNILGLYRTLLNDSDYMIFSKQKITNIEGKKERKTCYYIEKKT
jgi:hypothetical protein